MARSADTESRGLAPAPTNRETRIDVLGAGWVGGSEWGCCRRDIRHAYRDASTLPTALRRLGVITTSVRSWARLDRVSSLVCCAVGLALRDVPAERPIAGEIGIVGANLEGALDANLDFYHDYVRNDRQGARGNLFVQTLPSSPVSQASIQFRLCGPQYHVTPAANRLSEAVAAAALSVSADDAAAMVVVGTHGREALAVVVGLSPENADTRSLDAVVRKSGLTNRWWR